jgi:Uncharacterized conserved protein
MTEKPLLVGVDPGSTSAVAAIDLDGQTVFRESGKNFPPQEIIREIVEHGRPLMVACDKASMPSKVDKIASSTGSKTFSPQEDLSSERKKELGSGQNSHEKDAEASIRHAYRKMSQRFEKIDKRASETGLSRYRIASRVLSGEPVHTISVEEGQTDRDPDPGEKEGAREASQEQDEAPDGKLSRRNRRLEKKVSNLEDELEETREDLDEMRSEKEKYMRLYQDLRDEKKQEALKEEEISRREGIIKDKESRIDELEEKVRKSRIREKQYREGMNILESGGHILPVVEERESIDSEPLATRSDDLKSELLSEGREIYSVSELQGVELLDRVIVEEKPERDFSDVVKSYRSGRKNT